MSHKLHIVACSALALLVSAAAQARENPINQRIAGSIVSTFVPGGAPIFLTSDIIGELRGAPGPARNRSVILFGPPVFGSERCPGFVGEVPVVGGSGVSTHDDLSLLNYVFTSGFVCSAGIGAFTSITEATIVGGSGRFEGASGTLSIRLEGEDVGPIELVGSFTGTVSGTIIVGN